MSVVMSAHDVLAAVTADEVDHLASIEGDLDRQRE